MMTFGFTRRTTAPRGSGLSTPCRGGRKYDSVRASGPRRSGYGSLLISLGRAMEGAAVFQKVVQWDPLNARAWRGLGAALLFSEHFAEAREPLNRSLEI